MKKVIRLTESDLTKLIERVVNESQLDMNKQEFLKNKKEYQLKLTECFDSKKYPQLWKLTKGASGLILDIIMIAIGVASSSVGFGTILMGAGIMGASLDTYKIWETIKNSNSLKKELKGIINCLGLGWVIEYIK